MPVPNTQKTSKLLNQNLKYPTRQSLIHAVAHVYNHKTKGVCQWMKKKTK